MYWVGNTHKDLRAKTEPLGPVEYAAKRFGFRADALQRRVLESESARGILNCSRQWGKSTVTALKALYRVETRPESLVLIATPSSRQSGEFLHKVEKMLRRAGVTPKGDGYNEMSLQFPNGSRIVGLPGVEGTVRGFSEVSMMLIDEASRVEDSMYYALRPMLGVGKGDLWLMSTPFRKRGFFFEIWEHGEPEWFKLKASAEENPRVDAAFLAEELVELGEDLYRREYLCEFMDDAGAVFDRKLLENAFDRDVKQMEF